MFNKGPGGYPHPFNNHEQFDFGSFTGSLFEYPLVVGTRAYNGGSPGPNRCVVAFDDVTGNCDLVGAITHNGLPPGAPPNGFIRCA
ncbi:hypothetical protein DDE82_006815 [Stemphylium lycopersici]|uniref:Uncharacterized protein n=1 Tax=Stemphylium lycopersici TaxID=183478 RepID=A0A364N576_STELY|nr:guanyl-specific ribonuclease th1 [Stemphylium lycopersici]RAR01025.1 hypothetical protein DDE82_006815 [Stemphylium lycopersici]RAR12192.1 hypothetical protein DDE83_004197 [Stemphylium lycopersici]